MKLSRGEKFVEARQTHNRNGKQKLKDVYAASGVPASKISALENDDSDRGVDYREVAKLAKYYGVSLDYLIGDGEDPRPTPSQKAAASYLHLSDFATGKLAKAIVSEPYRSLFENIVKSGALTAILREIMGASIEIKKKEKALTDDNADVMEREVHHLQRDMCENIEAHLADITGRGTITYKIKAIQEHRKQEAAFDKYKAKLEDTLLWEESTNGEHTED